MRQGRIVLFGLWVAIVVAGVSLGAHAQTLADSSSSTLSVPGSAAKVDFDALARGAQAIPAASADMGGRSDIILQFSGWFTRDTTNSSIPHRATDSGGFNVGYRYHLNSWAALEGNYDFARFTNKYTSAGVPLAVQSDTHGITGNFVVGFLHHETGLRPFALAGGGVLIFSPTNNIGGTVPGNDTQTRGVFDFGGGVDYAFGPHLSVRVEYRGFLYKVPDFKLTALNTDHHTLSSVPSAGIVWTF